MKVAHLLRKARVAQCWYSAEDYEEIKAGMEDGHGMPCLYADWLAEAEQREDQVRRSGGKPVRVPFDLKEFFCFCADFGLPVNAKSRGQFASFKMQLDSD